MMLPDVVILAGGRGTRLQTTVPDFPKPMAPVAGKPFLEYLFEFLKKKGVQKIVISVGYLHEKIIDHFGADFKGIEIEYAIEHEPLGTGGGIKLALSHCKTDFVLVYNGDTFFSADPKDLVRFHQKNQSDISLFLKPMKNPARYGTVDLIGDKITNFKEKNDSLSFGLINAGVYCVRKDILDNNIKVKSFSFEKDILESKSTDNRIYGLISDSYFIDIGIPEDYKTANETFGNLEY